MHTAIAFFRMCFGIYLLLEKKRIRFARICGKGKLLFGRNAEKACFPRTDGRSGRQVRRIENVNSNRSEPLGSSFLDGYRYTRVNAVQKVTQEVVVGGNGRLGARARDAFRAVSSQNEKFAFSLR